LINAYSIDLHPAGGASGAYLGEARVKIAPDMELTAIDEERKGRFLARDLTVRESLVGRTVVGRENTASSHFGLWPGRAGSRRRRICRLEIPYLASRTNCGLARFGIVHRTAEWESSGCVVVALIGHWSYMKAGRIGKGGGQAGKDR
jgi:hypothetical protein